LVGVVFFGFLFAASSRATIQYQISLAHPEQHTFHIKMTVPNVSGSLTVQMPAWNALYEIRDFASHVLEVTAANESGALPTEKLDKQTWRIIGSGSITISYDTFWDEPGPFSSQLNSEHAFFNPAMILMYSPDRRNEEMMVGFRDVPEAWTISSPASIGSFQSSRAIGFVVSSTTYTKFADSPVEFADRKGSSLSNFSPLITLTIHGKTEHMDAFKEKLARICKYELVLMGGAPYSDYTFIFHIGENVGGGGMEHANGTAIAARNEETALTIAAHEFFHLWNVKRIRPASLEPLDYTKEQYTQSLWFEEGVTSTYEHYTLLRAGIWTKERFYEALGLAISELEASPAN